ncbi:nicotinamide/nicotinic acid mononucleotide adenylyltransferase 3 isoform X2 [Aethina tumida]|uniref:nicotinamide/nicotinic acid mononucleotide adenylyltransferase 3 isoform X2 n=1 Tax=Aethina tumida TaxID=116153 RepID=UPI0021473441|nr:nicotinamide/nicotinic acid mononucleotide adenylyltransferase 3 isoform X2 [Aethina tumida]
MIQNIGGTMGPAKIILLACGSFNPPTNMHLRMFEIARDHLHRMGTYQVIGGIISPVHDAYGKKELQCYTHRLAMTKLALQDLDWVKLSDWECKQETWSRTREVLQYHQNQINSYLHNNRNEGNKDECTWLPVNELKNATPGTVTVKLLCGGDLLESFGTPGLWSDEDIAAIVGQHGLVVITRSKTNPLEFIYNSDLLTRYMGNITIVTEWIRNEISSTKIRRALRRNESVKYLLPNPVLDYIYKNELFRAERPKYTLAPTDYNNQFLTPSPTDVSMESPSPTNCMMICNNNLFARSPSTEKRLSIDSVDSARKNAINSLRMPGQAVKIITERTGEHKVLKNETSLVRPACL